jgi:hypothetical protein
MPRGREVPLNWGYPSAAKQVVEMPGPAHTPQLRRPRRVRAIRIMPRVGSGAVSSALKLRTSASRFVRPARTRLATVLVRFWGETGSGSGVGAGCNFRQRLTQSGHRPIRPVCDGPKNAVFLENWYSRRLLSAAGRVK